MHSCAKSVSILFRKIYLPSILNINNIVGLRVVML